MHMAGSTCGDLLQLMKTIHHALFDVMKIMTCEDIHLKTMEREDIVVL